ncbi:MAG TPA: cell division protein FtsA [Candidatus Paceibacterota bacterium]|nr:cell division protein FtsA [Candidatus Paceibacterota bacterium]
MQKIAVGIDIGTHATRVVVCERDKTSSTLVVLGTGYAEARGMHHGYIVTKAEAAASIEKAVKEAEKSAGIKIKRATIALGGIGLSSEYAIGSAIITRADGVITTLDIEKAVTEAEGNVELKNKTIIDAHPVGFKIDGKEVPGRPEGVKGLKLEVKVLFITSFSQHLDDMLDVMQAVGVQVDRIVATPLAASKFVLTDLQRNFGCALVDIGAETVSVAVFENNTITSLHVFGLGSLDITKDIALGLRISPEEAENVKVGAVAFQTFSKKKLDEIIEARLSDIFELIDKYLKKIGRSGLLPAGAIIIGGGSQMALVETVAKALLRIPAKHGYADIPGVKAPISDQRFLTAYGSTLFGKEHSANDITAPAGIKGILKSIGQFLKQFAP